MHVQLYTWLFIVASSAEGHLVGAKGHAVVAWVSSCAKWRTRGLDATWLGIWRQAIHMWRDEGRDTKSAVALIYNLILEEQNKPRNVAGKEYAGNDHWSDDDISKLETGAAKATTSQGSSKFASGKKAKGSGGNQHIAATSAMHDTAHVSATCTRPDTRHGDFPAQLSLLQTQQLPVRVRHTYFLGFFDTCEL